MLPLNHSPIDDMEDMPVAVLAGLGFTRAILLGEFDRGRIRGRQALHDQKVSSRMPALVFAELNVRIHSAPAESRQTIGSSAAEPHLLFVIEPAPLYADLASCSRLNLPVREVNGCRSGSAELTFNHSMTFVPRG